MLPGAIRYTHFSTLTCKHKRTGTPHSGSTANLNGSGDAGAVGGGGGVGGGVGDLSAEEYVVRLNLANTDMDMAKRLALEFSRRLRQNTGTQILSASVTRGAVGEGKRGAGVVH